MEKLEEMQHRQDILSALSSVYPVIISANLTKNTYRMLEYQPILTHNSVNFGIFDELISMGLPNMKPEFQTLFLKTFSREVLVEQFLNGKTEVYEEIKQFCADGKEHWIGIHVIFISKKEEDIREICLSRIIDERKEKELNWQKQLETMNDTIQKRETSLREALEYEKLTNECMRIFYRVENLKYAVCHVMKLTGSYFQVDRAFVCEIHKERIFNTFEWCAEHVFSKKEFMQDIDIHIFDCWMPLFMQEKYAICDDLETLPETAGELKEFLKKMKISQMILIPVSFEGEMRLFLGYDNPKLGNENFMPMLDTLIAMALVGINRVYMERKRNILTYKDTMTALWNRTRMNEDIGMISGKKEAAGILFLDLNGLKEINDNHGHEAGDSLLKACAKVIQEKFPECTRDKRDWTQRAYRIGGDEFIIWIRNSSQEEFWKEKKELQEMYQMTGDCSVSIGGVFKEETDDIFKVITEADKLMYEDKKKYYRKKEKKDIKMDKI